MKKQTELLCKDCKHSFRTLSGIITHGFNSEYTFHCRKSFKPKHSEPNPVVGAKKVQAKYDSCGVARIGSDPSRDDRCGEIGKWWEPKHKRHLFLLIKKEAY
jgi:hypothetical protein